MRNKASSRTGLFLMELIIAVLFFALASAICIQLFVKSHLISESSVELNHGVLWAQNMAEAFYGCNGNGKEMTTLFQSVVYEKENDGTENLTLIFDGDFQPLATAPARGEEAEYFYCVSACISHCEDGLSICKIWVTELSSNNTIYELQVSLFPDKEALHAQ